MPIATPSSLSLQRISWLAATAASLLAVCLVSRYRPLRLSRRVDRSGMLSFPGSFMWGTATASFQIEGSTTVHRTPSIWDRFCEQPGNVRHGHTGDPACDHYNRFREDVRLLQQLGVTHYRFSLAWPRIESWPDSDPLHAQRNAQGIAFYNRLIDALLAARIVPVVTLYHWDLPLPVADAYAGWAGHADVARAFANYAERCFAEFGDRVKHWITLNEPWCSAYLGYDIGEHAPGDTSRKGVAVYRAGHNLLLAHARAVDVYRRKFQRAQDGVIGITLNSVWCAPRDANDSQCVAAADTHMAFELGWFAHPIYFGDYPPAMRRAVGDRLPTFSQVEVAMLNGSSDFFGLNHYCTLYADGWLSDDDAAKAAPSFDADKRVRISLDDSWPRTDMGWSVVPWGLTKLLQHIQRTYSPKGGIIITENGLAVHEPTVEAAANSTERVSFYRNYLAAVHAAIAKGVDVRGYFLWSLMDNFEWALGYDKRFGLYYVDYETQKRTAKPAVAWYAEVIRRNAVTVRLEGDEAD